MLRPNARSLSITSQESYSAIMITDLVADVPVNPEPEQSNVEPTKEETNLAYDGHMDGEAKSPAMEDTNSLKTNGAGISKGVILNAVQFGQHDSKTKIDGKPIQLSATLAVPTLTQQISEPKGFKDMSFQRKVAFGFSFLPSILFVLCFAVILPCNIPKSCVEEVWITKFNNTEATSRLEISENIMLTVLKNGENLLIELKKNNGKTNEIKLPISSAYLKCGKIMNESRTDCIVMDKSGNIYAFKDSQSNFLWNPVSETDEFPSPPVILSGCKDKMEDIAIAVSHTNIKVLYSGNIVSNFTVSHCDSVPVNLMPWTTNGSSDIVFVCDKGGEDRLVKVPKNVWCTFSKNPKEKPLLLQTGALDSIKNSILQPLDEGLVLWSSHEASMIKPDGTHLWSVSNLSHSEENRFILHGNFQGDNKQLAFFSSSITSGLTVTLLDPSDGSVVKSSNYLDTEATEVMHIRGKKKDFALLLLKKIKTVMDTVTTAFTQINDISTTIVNLISNESLNDGTPNPTSEELALLYPDGNLDTVKEIMDLKGSTYKSTMAVITDGETGILSVYHLSTLDNSQMKTTEVRNINVANWDKSTKSKCLAK